MRLRERVEVRQAGMEAGTARIEAGPLFSSGCPMGQVVMLRRLSVYCLRFSGAVICPAQLTPPPLTLYLPPTWGLVQIGEEAT